MALAVVGTYAAVLALILFIAHRVPLYGVETDLFGEFIPAARSLLSGRLVAEQYTFKGPGYPLLLAATTFATFGDAWFAARLLNLAGAIAAAGFAVALARRAAGDVAAVFVLVALCVNPLFVRTTIEAGTDMPTFALSLAATWLALAARGVKGAAGAGFLAGLAILCRYNAAFLVPAGLFALLAPGERSVGRPALAGAYVLGLLLPVAPWLVLNQRMSGHALGNANYANLAFELYGRGMPWDRFWTEVAPRFRSYADVVGYDPAGALLHWGRNLATRWLVDARQLVPAWMGVAAVLGVLLHVRSAPRRLGLLVHFALCYATLALVFYAPRFFLYLVPFYLLAAALTFFPRPGAWAGWRRGRALAAGLALVASAVVAVRETATLLRETPVEVAAAGGALRTIARPGDRLLARKPQVAYFANMEYVPFPQVETLAELLASAREAGARYMNLSGIEGSLRPQFRLLEQAEVRLPGFTLVARDVSDPNHYYALYRIEPAAPADSALGDSLLSALRGMVLRNADHAPFLAYAGALFLDGGRLAEAVACLDRAVALDPTSSQARGYRAVALLEAGRLQEAARDCEQVIGALARPPASFHVLLGHVRSRQGRLAEAISSFEAATKIEPANVSAQLVLGLAELAGGDPARGRAILDRAVSVAPGLAPLRTEALARATAGDVPGLARMIEIVRRTVEVAGSSAPPAADGARRP